MGDDGPTDGATARPLPSLGVLLSVYQRTRYYREALDSVARQEGSLPEVQVVIVRGPNVEIEVPSGLKARGWDCKVVASDEPGEGRFMGDGLRALTADLVLPLDDDDAWSPLRLATLARRFAEFPAVGYYHNAQRFVDETGVGIPAVQAYHRLRRYSGVPSGGWRVLAPDDLRRSPELAARWGSAFNNSSVAIRRSVVEEVWPELSNAGWLFDLFLFYAALSRGRSLLFDTAPLTTYRIHATNRSRGDRTPGGPTVPSTGAAREGRLASLGVIRSMVERGRLPWLLPWVERDQAFFELLEGLRDGERDRLNTARRIARLVRRARYGDPMMNAMMALAGTGQLLSPSSALRAYWAG